jgi:ubiquinone/menaquinone biosynthesis C-methylase UbiE
MTSANLTSRLVNGILAIQPIAQLAKHNARQMMIKRAASIGVFWMQEVETLKARDWQADLAAVQTVDLPYPDYYQRSFHAYDVGNLGWEPAFEVEVAAHAVHARIFPDAGAAGDRLLRQSYHNVLQATLPVAPQAILDLGCSVGMSTFALQTAYPKAAITGLDLSEYFLAVAHHRTQERLSQVTDASPTAATIAPTWLHAAAESTGLPDASFDLVSACLVFHELPQSAATTILQEARRLLRPGGHFALMDMNPRSQVYAKMPPYILTLLKSTEPYLDQYFALDLEAAIVAAGFEQPTIVCNTPRHRTVVASTKN